MSDVASSAVLDRSLDAVAERCDDLTPHVCERFFRSCPEAQALFRLDERTRGRMLGEILVVLVEVAQGRDYMPTTIDGLVKDHTSYGDIPLALYRGLLDALVETMAALRGDDWTAAYEAAWREAVGRLIAMVARSRACPVPIHLPAEVNA